MPIASCADMPVTTYKDCIVTTRISSCSRNEYLNKKYKISYTMEETTVLVCSWIVWMPSVVSLSNCRVQLKCLWRPLEITTIFSLALYSGNTSKDICTLKIHKIHYFDQKRKGNVLSNLAINIWERVQCNTFLLYLLFYGVFRTVSHIFGKTALTEYF